MLAVLGCTTMIIVKDTLDPLQWHTFLFVARLSLLSREITPFIWTP